MQLFTFELTPQADLDLVWQQLEEQGCHLLYGSEDEGVHQIFGYLPEGCSPEMLMAASQYLAAIKPSKLPAIDWEAQWAAYAPGYRDGFMHLDLHTYYPEMPLASHPNLRLAPGPGFGDLSHPTTRLVMKLMGPYIFGKHVLDVGCGSGILTLAALGMGAASACGIDIDDLALSHAAANAELNSMQTAVCFATPEDYIQGVKHTPLVVLMNMIKTEQIQAWQTLAQIHPDVDLAITSGILTADAESYLQLSASWGWHLEHSIEEEGWDGYVFRNRP